jgi:hypothetical protein
MFSSIIFAVVMLHLLAGFGYGLYKISVGDGGKKPDTGTGTGQEPQNIHPADHLFPS